jgi:hypothetical protein
MICRFQYSQTASAGLPRVTQGELTDLRTNTFDHSYRRCARPGASFHHRKFKQTAMHSIAILAQPDGEELTSEKGSARILTLLSGF